MHLEILTQTPMAAAPGYDLLTARAHHAIAPDRPEIPDLTLAPTTNGLVHFSGDVCLLIPRDGGNHRLFLDWGNRGNKRAIQYFNDAPGANDPTTLATSPAHLGNRFLFRRGYTIAFAAWQGDLLPGDGRMLLNLPTLDITGPVTTEIIGKPNLTTTPLSGWASTRSHPTTSLDPRHALLRRRRYPGDTPEIIPPTDWDFARIQGGVGLDAQGADRALVPCRESITLHTGFQPGWIYELTYEGAAPLPLGLCHPAISDLVAHLRWHPETPTPNLERAYGWGRSQTGRAIRDFIYRGFNATEDGRKIFEGLLPHVAGAGRLNLARFANLTVPAGQQYEDHDNPADAPPFAYAPCPTNPDAILKRPETDPLVIHTQTATEYWQRRGSLVHTTPDGQDLPIPPTVRIHLWSSSQHAASPTMSAPTHGICQNLENVVATSALFRATLDSLDAWSTHAIEPPPSTAPTIASNTLVPYTTWRTQFPPIPGIALPSGPSEREGHTILVPAVDPDGNEIAGIRAPMVAAPLATYTGWNLRKRGHGHGAMHEFTGSTIPLPTTDSERTHTNDPRPSIIARYPTQAAYTEAITSAAESLAAAGYLLAEDIPRAEAASANWGAPRHRVDLRK